MPFLQALRLYYTSTSFSLYLACLAVEPPQRNCWPKQKPPGSKKEAHKEQDRVKDRRKHDERFCEQCRLLSTITQPNYQHISFSVMGWCYACQDFLGQRIVYSVASAISLFNA